MRDMCDEVIESGSWLGGQKLGLVALLFKDKGQREDWKNWRPIMLLDMDRKLVTKCRWWPNRFWGRSSRALWGDG